MENANMAKLTSMHFYAWKSGLKTGMYYLRTKSAVDAIKFTLNNETKKEPVEAVAEAKVEAVSAASEKPLTAKELKDLLAQSKNAAENDEDCLMCGS